MNYKQRIAIEQKNKRRFLAVNPHLDEGSGIYILRRKDENGINHCYIGQALRLLTRLSQHCSGYQYIDLSLKKHGLISTDNPHGWTVGFVHCPVSELDVTEQEMIKSYASAGYQMKNRLMGSQGEGRTQLNECRPSKGYRDGILQGRKSLSRELSHIIEKHLVITLKPDKQNNKVSQKALEKFWSLLKEGEEDGKSETYTDTE